tara:strand:+ start:194 stop:439 length:246 start_codon:yes stop_codon:yes gene_type:complete
MALSRGQFTNVISKGKKMAYKNPTGPQKFKKKDTDQLSEKRKLQMGEILPKLKSLYPVSNKDIAFLKKNMPKIKSKKKLKR